MINFVGRQAFRLEENLMLVTIGKAHDLVFDRRTVAGTDPFNHAGIHRAAIEVITDHVMRFLVGMRDVPAPDADAAKHLP